MNLVDKLWFCDHFKTSNGTKHLSCQMEKTWKPADTYSLLQHGASVTELCFPANLPQWSVSEVADGPVGRWTSVPHLPHRQSLHAEGREHQRKVTWTRVLGPAESSLTDINATRWTYKWSISHLKLFITAAATWVLCCSRCERSK